jgi:hypothetical protein
MNFESWLGEMISRIKTIEKECLAKGVGEKAMDSLVERGVEPYGLWKKDSLPNAQAPISEEGKLNAIAAAKKKYGLNEVNDSLVIQKSLEPTKFKECASFLKGFGYSYDKGIKGFKKEVKQ